MATSPSTAPLLAGVRVIDTTDDRGELAGRLLADLGADVIKIEPPEGVRSRRLPPFNEQPGHAAESLYWAAVGLGKRSVVLDLEDHVERARFRELVARADILVESFAPGRMAELGLSYEELSVSNTGLVYCSIAPFGQTGPKADWPATELTIEAAGGLVILQGNGDRPPIPVGVPQAAFHAGAQAAADCVIAMNERAISGLGQRLDTSMQEGIMWTLLHSTGFPPNTGGNPPNTSEERALPLQSLAGLTLVGQSSFECADGYLLIGIGAGMYQTRIFDHVIREVAAAGELDERLAHINWSQGFPGMATQVDDLDVLVAAAEAFRGFLRTRTKAEVMSWASDNDLMIAPVHTTEDLHRSPQLASRQYWVHVDGLEHPGASVKLSRTPMRLKRGAPSLGEHQGALDELLAEPVRRTGAATTGERIGEAFAGLKVADFSWIGVGPISAKALADHGATVVHIESATRPDVLRLAQPTKDGIPGLDRSQFFADYNSSKLGLALNLATDEGRTIALRMIEWADVVVESFTPGTMAKLGLDPDAILSERPDLIWYSTCLLGQTGPYATFAGFGQQGSAIAGIHGITGWPDRAPTGTWGAYTDMIAPHYGGAALASAILERRETGLGQRIDMSQVEAAMHFMEPALLDYTVNGHVAQSRGLDSNIACPHSTYPTRGTERYIAIACETDEQWEALCGIAPLDEFTHLADLKARLRQHEAIDEALLAWCADREPFELEAELSEAGVPVSVAQFATDLYQDPQVAHRGFFVTLNHTVMGPTPYDGLITRFSAKQEMLHKAAPIMGEDTVHVLTEFLGMSADEIEVAAIAGALS